MLEVLIQNETPENESIQLERWGDHLEIGAYPKAKNTFKWIQKGKPFRLSISRNLPDDAGVKELYAKLILGIVKLEDLGAHYWYDQDHFLMDLNDKEARCFA